MQCTYFHKAVVEMQSDEASSDTTVILEGSSHCLLHQGLRGWAGLAVEPDLQASSDSSNREEGKDGNCQGGEQGVHGEGAHFSC